MKYYITLPEMVGYVNRKTGLIETNIDEIEDNIDEIEANIDSPTYSTEEESSGSVISLPSTVEGGELELDVDGVTASNLVTNGDFSDGTTGWSGIECTISASDNIAQYTDITSRFARFESAIDVNVNELYFIKAGVGISDITELSSGISIELTDSDNLESMSFVPSANNEFGLSYGIFRPSINNVNLRTVSTLISSFDSNVIIKIKNVVCIPMTDTPYESFTADEMNEAFPSFFDETKSVDKMRVLSVGKNLFDKSDVNYGNRVNGTGDIVVDVENVYSNYRPCSPSASYVETTGSEWRNYYTINKEWISSLYTGSGGSLVGTTPSNCYFLIVSPEIIYLDTFQLELGTTATTYEEYTETYSACNLPLRSVPAIADKIASNVGLHTQNVSDLDSIATTDYDSIDTATYTNVDVVKTTAYTLSVDATTGIDGIFRVYNSDGNPLVEVAQADIDLTASVGKFYYHTDETIWFIVADATYVDIAAARIGLGTSTAYYQVATPITTQLIPNSFIAQPSGTVYQEAYVEDVAVYATEITIVDTDLPVLNLTHLNKIDITNGNLTQIPLSDVTIAVGGLTFTITGASAGEYYDFGYNYSSTLSLNGAVSYSYAVNLKGQVDSNTKMISQNNVAINQIVSYMKMLEDRIVVLEP